MKISLNWLQEYIDPLDAPEALSDALTFAGIEVEGVETKGANFPKVVVAQILSSEPHPNADRLSVCKVDDGSPSPRQIVCGAKNYAVGDKVPLAQPGAVLPGNFRIKVGKLRGVESEGMLCSAKELNIPAETDAGLLILSPEAKVGTPISELFPSETIFDLEVTPNRPDLLSHAGIARELAAFQGRQLRWPQLKNLPSEPTQQLQLEIQAEAKTACPFYTARLIRGVKVGPSPDWLRNRLEAVGIRSINNVVDITNFVLLELGQPLHAFDAAKIKTFPNLAVRFARPQETLLALDEKTYTLQPHHLVIAEADLAHGNALAIAGIMGGKDSEVTLSTQDIVLESAYFHPASIRRAGRELGLSSDSSYRFERGVDPALTEFASTRAAELILETAGGTLYPLVAAKEASHLPSESEIEIDYNRCRTLLGIDKNQLPDSRLETIFTHFGLKKLQACNGQTQARWVAPTHRQDLKREEDLIEEVTRVFGLENVPSRTKAHFVKSSPADEQYNFQMRLRQQLAAIGFAEAKTSTLISESAANEFVTSKEPLVQLKNPLSEEQAILRNSLLPGLLQVVGNNTRIGISNLRLFEIGRVYSWAQVNSGKRTGQPEPQHLAIAMSGQAITASWQNPESNTLEFADLHGALERIVHAPIQFKRTEPSSSAWAIEAEISAHPANRSPLSLGRVGQVKPVKAEALDLRAPLFLAELDLDPLFELYIQSKSKKFVPLQRFPGMTRDLALVVDQQVTHQQIVDALKTVKEPLLTDVQLFDVFTDPKGEKIPADKKSLAYTFTYQAADRTLKTEEVEAAHDRLKSHLTSTFSLRFRE